MSEPSTGVRRLCIAAAAGRMCLLTSACRATDVDRLWVTVDQNDGTETACAPPGIDEVAVVTRLIAVLHRLAAGKPGVPRPALMAFHVGITRIEGEGFGGEAPLRTQALLRDPAIRAAAVESGRALAVIMSDGLYADLRAEGLPGQDWQRMPAARAWLRCCGAGASPQARGPG